MSPEALLWLYENGMKEIAKPVKSYYGGDGKHAEKAKEWEEKYKKDLKEFEEYLKDPKTDFCLTVFSPDKEYVLSYSDIERNNPLLIKCIKTLKKDVNGSFADIKIVTIPDGTDWEIDNYDGMESVEEKHNSWN